MQRNLKLTLLTALLMAASIQAEAAENFFIPSEIAGYIEQYPGDELSNSSSLAVNTSNDFAYKAPVATQTSDGGDGGQKCNPDKSPDCPKDNVLAKPADDSGGD